MARCIVFGLLLFGTLAWGRPSRRSERPRLTESTESTQSYVVSFGFDLAGFDYAETVPAPLKSTESGALPGFKVGFLTEPTDHGWFVSGVFDIHFGTTNFDGTDQTGNPIRAKTSNSIFEFEADAGLLLTKPSPSTRLLGYSGIGYHFWRRDLADYLEDYSWFYFPLGLRFESQASDRVTFGIDIAGTLSFAGRILIYLSDLDPRNRDVDANLGSGLGFRFRLPINFQISELVLMNVTPWFQYFPIGEGDPVQTTISGSAASVNEPASRTYYFGARLSFGVCL